MKQREVLSMHSSLHSLQMIRLLPVLTNTSVSVSTGPGPEPLWFGYISHKKYLMLLLALGEYLMSSNGKCMYATFSTPKSYQIANLMQAYIESVIWFGLTTTKLLAFLNRPQSTCGWTILSLTSVNVALPF